MHGDATMQQITACLWFNDQAEEAARFYPSIFTNSAIGAITHDGEGSPRPKGSVLTVLFQLHGQEFLALNGGPHFPFTEAMSFIVHCETQQELDVGPRTSVSRLSFRCGDDCTPHDRGHRADDR